MPYTFEQPSYVHNAVPRLVPLSPFDPRLTMCLRVIDASRANDDDRGFADIVYAWGSLGLLQVSAASSLGKSLRQQIAGCTHHKLPPIITFLVEVDSGASFVHHIPQADVYTGQERTFVRQTREVVVFFAIPSTFRDDFAIGRSSRLWQSRGCRLSDGAGRLVGRCRHSILLVSC